MLLFLIVLLWVGGFLTGYGFASAKINKNKSNGVLK